MGWMRTLLLGDIGNRLDISDAERSIDYVRRTTDARIKNVAAAKENQIRRLKTELAQQRLATEALTRYLIQKGVVDEAELAEFIDEVDAEDGQLDGQLVIDPANGRLRLVVPDQGTLDKKAPPPR